MLRSMTFPRKGKKIGRYDDRLMIRSVIFFAALVGVAVALVFLLTEKGDALLRAFLLIGLVVLAAGGVMLYMQTGHRVDIRNRQAMARMLLENRWFETEPLQRHRQGGRMERITYFSALYYRRKGRYIYVTVKISMGKYQEALLHLEEKLETGLSCELIEKDVRDIWVRYTFLNDVEKNRLSIEDVTAQDGRMKLMRHIEWEYDSIERYAGMEKLLYDRIKKNFRFRRLEKKDFGYIIEHIYGRQKTPYYTYSYDFPSERVGKKTLIRKYDILRLTRCLLEEHQKHIRIAREEGDSYVAYLTVNALIGELTFPSSEIFYYQQAQSGFDFPVDVSMNVEIVPNVNALTTVRNKKKELKDLDEHAYTSGNDTEDSVIDALESVDELEQDLGRTKESMYKLSYVVRVAAETRELLERRVVMVRDYYEHSFNMKLVRPFGDMTGLHEEFVPAGKRWCHSEYADCVFAVCRVYCLCAGLY